MRKLGGTVDDTELVQGLVFTQKASKSAGGPSRMPNAKIAVLQFQLSPPKTDIENTVIVSDYQQMDRILKEERTYTADLCKKIAKTGANVILLQKSILRDAITDLGLHFLAKLKIMLIRDIERDEIEFICKVGFPNRFFSTGIFLTRMRVVFHKRLNQQIRESFRF